MTDNNSAGTSSAPLPDALARRRPRMSVIWVIPIVAVLIALWLGYQTWENQGPSIVITFQSADGLTAGTTLVKHKNVTMGTVRSIKLSNDMTHVILKVDMNKEAGKRLTSTTRFWVVKPRFGASGISGLDTLVSGAYIEMDPGSAEGEENITQDFVGLETPPIVRADVPGKEFLLVTERLGSLSAGSPIFYRDVQVGEVLGYDLEHIETSVTLHIFVRAPFDKHIFEGTRFWNVSGITFSTGPEGFRVQLESLQAIFAGGIAFDTPVSARKGDAAKEGGLFTLYKDSETASYAGSLRRDQYLIYFDGSVAGLTPGSPVQIRGIPVGRVVDIKIEYDSALNEVRVPVLIEFDPEGSDIIGMKAGTGREILTKLVAERGLRAQLQSASFITGQQMVALEFFPDAPPATVEDMAGYPVIPSMPSNLDSILHSVETVANKLAALPLDALIKDARDTIESLNGVIAGPEVKNVLLSLAGTLASADQLMKTADASIGPAMKDLPKVMASVKTALGSANSLLTSIDQGYGDQSSFRRDLTQTLLQAEDALRSIRVLADFIERNPQALILGPTGD